MKDDCSAIVDKDRGIFVPVLFVTIIAGWPSPSPLPSGTVECGYIGGKIDYRGYPRDVTLDQLDLIHKNHRLYDLLIAQLISRELRSIGQDGRCEPLQADPTRYRC